MTRPCANGRHQDVLNVSCYKKMRDALVVSSAWGGLGNVARFDSIEGAHNYTVLQPK